MKNKYKLVFGVGVNDADYAVTPVINKRQVMCPFYRAWKDLLMRCYSEKCLKKHPTYIGVTVCKEWHSFMSFRKWMINQDWQGKQLDKDLLVLGNKEYSPEACMFVTRSINCLLNDHGSKRGNWPLGVDFVEISNKFRSSCSINGKQKGLGYFYDAHSAHRAWQLFKIAVINTAANNEKDLKISNALKYIASKINTDYENNVETKK